MAFQPTSAPPAYCDTDEILTKGPVVCGAIELLEYTFCEWKPPLYSHYLEFAKYLLKSHDDPKEEAKRTVALASIGKCRKLPDDMLAPAAHQIAEASSEHVPTNEFLATIREVKHIPNVVLYLLKNMPSDVQRVIRTSILQFLTPEGFTDFLKRLTLTHVEQALTKGFRDNNEPLNRLLRAMRYLAMVITHLMRPNSTPPKPSKHLTDEQVEHIRRQAEQALPLVCALRDVKHQLADTAEMATTDAAIKEHEKWALDVIADNIVAQWMKHWVDKVSKATDFLPTDKDKEGKSEDNTAIATDNAERTLRNAAQEAADAARLLETLLKQPGSLQHSQAKAALATLAPDGDLDAFIAMIVARLRVY